MPCCGRWPVDEGGNVVDEVDGDDEDVGLSYVWSEDDDGVRGQDQITTGGS